MAMELGTYGSSVFAPLLWNALPLPGESITWDWMNAVGLFTQRFRRIATMTATVTHGNYATFNYAGLRADYFPPYLEVYYHSGGQWHKYYDDSQFYAGHQGYWGCLTRYVQFVRVGVATAFMYNYTGNTKSFKLVAYL